MFEAIIFDLDGTLVDSYPGILESLNATLKAFRRKPVDLAVVKKMVGRGIENLMQQAVGVEQRQEAIRIFRESYDKTHLTGTFLMRGVYETLSALKNRATKMAVASNKPADYTENILRHLKINLFFNAWAGPSSEIQTKPHPSMLRSLIQKLNSSTDTTLYVGDMTLDAETARNAGVRVALISGGGGTLEELEAVKPDFLLNKFSDLLKITGPSH